jgi:hypothetical protein
VPNVNNYELITGTAHYWPIEKLTRHRSPGVDHISTEMIQAGSKTIDVVYINLLVLFGMKRNCLGVDDLKLNGTHYLLVCALDVNILDRNVHTIKKNTDDFVVLVRIQD